MIKKFTQKGFTLIELLIVIAIIAVLAIGLIVAINPQDKIRQANDTKVLTDVAQIGRAADAYAAQNGGSYPSTNAPLTAVSTGELRAWPSAPATGGYGAYAYTPSGCVAAACTSLVVTGDLKSNKYTGPGTPFARWESSTGKVCATAAVGTACL